MQFSPGQILEVSHLFLAAQLVGQSAVGVVDADAPPEIRLRVLDPLQLVGAQLKDSLALLALPQLWGYHGHTGSMMMVADGRGATGWSKHVRIFVAAAAIVVVAIIVVVAAVVVVIVVVAAAGVVCRCVCVCGQGHCAFFKEQKRACIVCAFVLVCSFVCWLACL